MVNLSLLNDVAILYITVCVCVALLDLVCMSTLSASAFIEPSLHQLDFFFEIILWRLLYSHTVLQMQSRNSLYKQHTNYTVRFN